METSLKTGFAQIFSCCPKSLSCPNFGGAAAPLAPPARTPMINYLVLSRDHLPLVLRSPGKKPLIESPLRLKGSELLFGATGSKKGKKEIN